MTDASLSSSTLNNIILPILYMLAAAGFIMAIKWLNSPATARRGVVVGEI